MSDSKKKLRFSTSPILNIFSWKFQGLVLGWLDKLMWRAAIWLNQYGCQAVRRKLKKGVKTLLIFLPDFLISRVNVMYKCLKDILRQNSLIFLTLIGIEGTFKSLLDRLVDSFEGLFAFSPSKPPFANFFPKCSDYILRSLHLYTFLFWPPSHYR